MLTKIFSVALVVTFITSTQLYAVPTKVVHQDAPTCDPLFIPTNVDEIGDILIFPPDEALERFSTQVNQPVCLPTDNPAVPDALVGITNFTGRDLIEVWYIANNDTRISNIDGYATDIGFPISDAFDNETFRIDNDISDPGGIHHPLVFESGPIDGIWNAGETWHFILQDYSNLHGIAADTLTSIGVGDASISFPGTGDSSGSIIAIPIIPEPTSAMLLCCAVSCTLTRRRQR